MKTYDEMAENVFRRRDEYIKKKKEQRKKTVKVSVSFACVMLVLFAGFGLWKGDVFAPEVKQAEDAIYPGVKDYYSPDEEETIQSANDAFHTVDEAPTYNGKLLVSYYENVNVSACYALPKNGDFHFSIPLNAAFREYNDEVIYRVVVRVFEDGEMLQSKNELEPIAEKFYKWGYTSALEITDDNWDHAVLTLIATEEELKNFEADDENGYFFFLYLEPDGKGEIGNSVTEE